MKVIIDADGCPVTKEAAKICQQFKIPCHVICDTAHIFSIDNAQILTVDKGADSADFSIANRVASKDIVITQDYGLAAMCLTRGARVLHQDGWEYTSDNIDALLLQRHTARKNRSAGIRIRGPKKRSALQNQYFTDALFTILQTSVQG